MHTNRNKERSAEEFIPLSSPISFDEQDTISLDCIDLININQSKASEKLIENLLEKISKIENEIMGLSHKISNGTRKKNK